MLEPRPSSPLRVLLLVATLIAAPPSLVLAQGTLSGNAAERGAVNIDTADADTLAESLPGIGPVKARRIVEYRERHGPFGTIDALQAVKGIGPVTVARIRAHLEGRAEGDADDRADGTSGARRAPAPDRAGAGSMGSASPPRSTLELERRANAAVRSVVAEAEREAVPYR